MPIELVDLALCNGCRLCMDTCAMDVIRMDTLPGETSEFPPCRVACPAHVDMRSYIYLLKEGMYEEAADILRDTLPFPSITGRVCPHPCETECARKDVDTPVNVNCLERFAGDCGLHELPPPVLAHNGSRVAIVGSGPAGMSCAYFLAREGHAVTVFESMPKPGGMLRQALPEYRLPAEVLDLQIDFLERLGVEFRTGVTVGKDVALDDLAGTYKAIFWGTGCQTSRKVELPGLELEGVLWGLDFLREVKRGRLTRIEGKVAVIGGGNVALDAALTAMRLGAEKVDVACLETAADMPAYRDEIRQAAEEGVSFHTSWGPSKLLGRSGALTGIELVRCLSVFDPAGKFDPALDPAVTLVLEADTVIFAIGQSPDTTMVPAGIALAAAGTISIDVVTLQTSLPGIFSGGDIVSGPSTVIAAIAAGKQAAVSIGRYVRGEDLAEGRTVEPARVGKTPREGIAKMTRQEGGSLPVSARVGNFREVMLGLDEAAVRLEAERCMTCGSRASISYVDDCQLCLYCERDCPQKAITVSPAKKVDPLLAWG